MLQRLLVRPLFVAALLAACPAAFAQSAPADPPASDPAAVSTARPLDIDQSLISLPTTLPLHAHKGYFRLTHRFARDLGRGSFGSLADDFFSLDSGAVMGLEYRYGITSTLQAGVHRSTLGKTLQPFARWDVVSQSDRSPIGISPIVSVEGQNNLRQDPQPGASVVLSRRQGTRLALYAAPTYVHDAHTATLRLLHEGHSHDLGDAEDPAESSTAVDTFFICLGARLRVRETVSLVVEASPRVAGYTPDTAAWGAAIEKMTRGHVLQLNFGNSFATTPGLVARGGTRHEVYMGFNLSRKF